MSHTVTNIYFIRCGDFVKIGRGVDVEARVAAFNTGSPYEMQILGVIVGSPEIEARLHQVFSRHRHRGEWFHAAEDLMSYITRETSAFVLKKSALERSVSSFLQTVPKSGKRVRAGTVYSQYVVWCHERSAVPVSMKRFGCVAASLGVNREAKHNRVSYII